MTVTRFMLFDHLRKEDDYFCPELEKFAEGGKLAKSYAKEMKALTEKAEVFFERFERQDPGIGLAKEFGEFIGVLKNRIIKEDNTLLPK